MKILFVSTNDHVPWGGSEVLWSKASVALAERGHEVMASLQKWEVEPPAVQDLRKRGVAVHLRQRTLNTASRWNRALTMYRRGYVREFTDNTMEALDVFRPQHVVFSLGDHLNGPFVPYAAELRERSIPYDVIVQLVHPFAALTDDRADRLVEAYSRARTVIFVSEQNRKIAMYHLGHPFPNAKVVPNPVDLPVVSGPAPYPESASGFELAMVGALVPFHKGQDVALEVFALPKWRERRIRLNIYGEGHGRRVLERSIAMRDLRNVVLHGFVRDRSAIWAANHAALFASRMEGLSLALLEAMASGRMVISTDTGGAGERISEGRTGFIAAYSDLGALDLALEAAWSERERWKEMGVAAQNAYLAVTKVDPVERLVELLLDPSCSDG